MLRQVGPARLSQIDRLLDGAIEIDFGERELRFALSVKLPHAGNSAGHVVDGPLYRRQVRACPLAEIGLALEQRLRIKRHGRDGIVDVVRNAAGHLPQGAQAFLLHHGVLGLTEVVIGLLQGAVELSLLDRQCDVLTELVEELAVGAGEGIGAPARGEQHAEEGAVGHQWRHCQGVQLAVGESLGQRQWHRTGVRFVEQLAGETG